MSPRRLYVALALAEVVTWTLLLGGMVLKYVTRTTELGVQLAGPVHGFVFLGYSLVTVLLALDARWSVGRTLAGLVAGVVPYLTVPFERATDRAGLLPDRWRLREEEGRTAAERVLARALRSPLQAGAVAVVVLAVVFAALLVAGPPVTVPG